MFLFVIVVFSAILDINIFLDFSCFVRIDDTTYIESR